MDTTERKDQKMNYRYEISQDSIGDFRRTIISEKLDVLDPDGFTCDERTGDTIISEHGWECTKTVSALSLVGYNPVKDI